MPISPEQFEHLDDFRGLEKLHVYGDLLKLYMLPVHATIIEVGNLYREIQALESKMLTLYASYVLAHCGFYVELFASEDVVEAGLEPLHTTKFKDDEWIKNLDFFEPSEEDTFKFEWEVYYKNERQEKLKVVFITLFIAEAGLSGIELDEVGHLLKKFDKSCSNYALVHPKLSRQSKKTFMQAKEKMIKNVGQDLILSTGEFVAKLIPDNEKRHLIEENWNSLREKIVKDLRKKWPILIFAADAQQISETSELIRKSRIKYETHSFEDAIKDAGIACESLLQILYSVYVSKKTTEELEFYELLCALKEVLAEKFGSNIYQDLDFVRTWRNNVVHPKREKPDEAITLQVVTRAELFNELFKKKIFERNLRSTSSI
jgi:hypothetical protein